MFNRRAFLASGTALAACSPLAEEKCVEHGFPKEYNEFGREFMESQGL